MIWLLVGGAAAYTYGQTTVPSPTPVPSDLMPGPQPVAILPTPDPEIKIAPTPPPAPIRVIPKPKPVDYGPILEIRFQGLHAYEEVIVADIAGLEVGEEFNRDKLENSINALRKWGVFAQVEVLVQYESDGVKLSYDLKEGFIIKNIAINGSYPLLEGTVRRSLFLSPGQIYDSSKLPEQVDRLDRLYLREGYYDSTVFAIEDYNEADREVSLRFNIKKGKTYRIRDIEVEGNKAVSTRRIRRIIHTYTHYKPRKLKSNLEKIRKVYAKKGFVRARVRLEGEAFDHDARKVDLDVAVREGKRVFVRFQGNDHFRPRTLRKEITIYEDGDFDDYELEASKQKLKQFYRERGYENTIVTVTKEKIDPDNYLVTFKVEEGQKIKVGNIHFEGNEDVKSGDLRDLMATKEAGLFESGPYLKELFEQDLKKLEDYYKREGWLEAKVESWEKTYNTFGDEVILTVQVDENPRATVHELAVNGLSEAQQEDILPDLLLLPGNPYSPAKLDQDIGAILLKLSNQGFPYAQIKHDQKNLRDNLWDVSYDVDTGPEVRIGRLLFVGNSVTRETVIRKNLRFKEGSLFSTERILQSQINLRKLGIFDVVGIETLGLANKEEKVHAVVRVEEKKSKIIDLEAGYNTDQGFHGQLVFNKLNMWGMGKNGNIKLQGGEQISRFEINYVDPRVRGSGLQLLVGVFAGYENRPFFQNFATGGYSSLFYDFTSALSTYGRLEFEYVNFNEDNSVISVLRPPSSIDDRTRLTTTVGVTFDKRDNFGNPTKGYYLNGSVALTNQFIQRSGNYITTRGSAGYWYSPFPRLTIANALRVAKIFPVPGDTIVPVDDRLYLGGDDTVRGFDQDSILPTGGFFSLVHNLELQFRIFGNFQVVAFLDSGVDVSSMDQINLNTLRHSAGPGVRYLTPVGPVRVEYGFKLDPRAGESLGRLHFSFGYFF